MWFRKSFWVLLAGLCGCAAPELATADRMARGLVIVLPGVEGPGPLNVDIARGLDDGGVHCAIDIFDWGTGSPAGLFLHLTDLERNMMQARYLAQQIMRYRRAYPSRPVQLVGHSAGAGIALLALEALPDDVHVTSAILLGAAVSPEYDLRPALRHSRCGVYSFYSPSDVGFLGVGTVVFGTIDRTHERSAGAVGFHVPEGLSQEDRQLYAHRLFQVAWSRPMRRAGHPGGHLGWAKRRFVRTWLAPLVLQQNKAAAGVAVGAHRARATALTGGTPCPSVTASAPNAASIATRIRRPASSS